MLARRSTIRHPSGLDISTPLLIPSFSSKGMPLGRNGVSQVQEVFEYSGEFIEETLLVSAYDLFYKNLPPPDEWANAPELVFLDSGGYEVGSSSDLSEVAHDGREAKHWQDDAPLREVLQGWSDRIPAIAVSYDHPNSRAPFAEQVSAALDLFNDYPKFGRNFLIKPATATQMTLKEVMKDVLNNVDVLKDFDVVGITEKEAGHTTIDKMRTIAHLRAAMNEAKVNAAIQIFGSLDPLFSCLYFVSGAEVFDGLTWMRYSYHKGLAIYRYAHGPLELSLGTQDRHVFMSCLSSNVYYLKRLRESFCRFCMGGDFKHFGEYGDQIRTAYENLETTLVQL